MNLPPFERHRNLLNMTFGKWTVIGRVENSTAKSEWLCRCECGAERAVRAQSLLRGISKSCGCLSRSSYSLLGHTKGGARPTEYSIWLGMKWRCYSPKSKDYARYGGRGITICDRWKNSFQHFLEDMGPKPTPNHCIERIDNNGNYEPSNCCWATRKEQALNRIERPRNHDGRYY